MEKRKVSGLLLLSRTKEKKKEKGSLGEDNLHHVALVILVVTQRQQDDVALVDPDLLSKFATNVAKSACAVETLGLEATIAGGGISK